MHHELYVFVDNSFLYIQGYKHVATVTKLPPTKKLQLNYPKFRKFVEKSGNVKRLVLVGSDLSGALISVCQRWGFEVVTLPKYPDLKTGAFREKGVDQKIGWEVAKTIFTNKESTQTKKIILCTGDKDFASILPDIHTSNWFFELWLWHNSYSANYAKQVEVFGEIRELDTEWKQFIEIV